MSGPAPHTAGTKILALESLRGLAAVCVALYHFRTHSPLTENAFIQNAHLMVDFFFVLSGFVISLNYTDRLRTLRDVAWFQRKRFWRLYPLHFVLLLAFVGIEATKYWVARSRGIHLPVPPFSQNDLGALLNNLLLTQALFENHLTFNYPSWSISCEFYTYLLFGLAAVAIRGAAVFGFAALTLGSLFALSQFDSVFTLTTGAAILRCSYAFFLGALVERIAARTRVKASEPIAIACLIVSILAVMNLAHTRIALAIPALFALTIVAISRLDSSAWLCGLLNRRALIFLGTISYSVYLVHAALWWIITQVLRFGLKIPATTDAEGITRIELGPLQSTALVLVGLALLVGLSRLTFVFVEDRFRHGPRRFRVGPSLKARSA